MLSRSWKSFSYLEKSRKVLLELGPNDTRMAYIFNNLDEVHQNKGDTRQALQSYEMTLHIFQITFIGDHETLACCYNNLGIIHYCTTLSYKSIVY